MRSDDGLTFGDGFVPRGLHNLDGQLKAGASHSGNERNHLFLNLGEGAFEDASSISGLDSPADGRVFSVLDFDRDGHADLAVVNANPPLLELYQSQLGGMGGGRFAGLRFVGSNRSTSPEPGRSNRDGIGARVEWRLGERRIVRENTRGHGFATQNSPTLLVGLGDAEGLPEGRVYWPSGKEAEIPPIEAGQLITLFEDPADGPDGAATAVAPYAGGADRTRLASRDAGDRRVLDRLDDAAPFRLLTSMATWCLACRREVPALATLRERFAEAELSLYGVPIDPNDSRDDLIEWRDEQAPAYALLLDLPESDRGAFEAAIRDTIQRDALPASLLTDGAGRIVHGQLGIPSISTLRQLGVGGRRAAP